MSNPPTSPTKGINIVGASIFGAATLALIGYVVIFVPCLEGGRLRLVGFLCALLGGLASGFIAGQLRVEWQPVSALGKVALRGGGGLAVVIAVLIWWSQSPPVGKCQDYRIQVNVSNSKHEPVNHFDIWTSIDNTQREGSGSWSFTVAESNKPPDGKITIYATKKSAYLSGETTLVLAQDYNLTVPLELIRDTSARIRGHVIDDHGNPQAGVRVSVNGSESEGMVTESDGKFDLAAHAAPGEQVQIYAKKDAKDSREWFPAGPSEVTITIRQR